MTTPEGTTKKNIRSVLDKYESRVYYDMPVPYGYGKPTLDFVGCAHGWYFAIEAKAWNTNKGPSPRQEGTRDDMRAAGGQVFVVNDQPSLDIFSAWLRGVCDASNFM